MIGIRVALSSGDVFWVDGDAEAVRRELREGDGLVWIGHRLVNPMQVAMLTYDQIPSIESPERLHHEEEAV